MSDRAIWQSAQNLIRIKDNLNNLCKEFDGLEIEKPMLKIEREKQDFERSDWCNPVYEVYYSVSKKKAQGRGHTFRPAGWITVAVQLTSATINGMPEWEYGQRAKVLVGYTSEPDFYDDAWGFDTALPDASGACKNCTATDLIWTFNEDGGANWFYAIPLEALNSRAQVEKLIIRPMHQVVEGATISSILASARTEICLPPAFG